MSKEIINNVLLIFFYRNPIVEKLCESKEVSQYGENFSLISNLSLNKKTTRVKQHKCRVCGKIFVFCSLLSKHFGCHTGQKTYEFQKDAKKPYKCKECNKAFS